MTMTRETAEALTMFADTFAPTPEDVAWHLSQVLDSEEREREAAWAEYLEGSWVDPIERML